MLPKSTPIYIAGHTGLIGSACYRLFSAVGFTHLITQSHDELELCSQQAVNNFFKTYQPSVVILAAGKVGGIADNKTFPADYISTNLNIQLNVLNAAKEAQCKKVIFFGSSCMYPRNCTQPMPEQALLTGRIEPTSAAYAMAKLAGLQTCLAFNQQTGKPRFIPLIPNSAYGPYDNFDPNKGHLLSALIARFHHAKQINAQSVTLWGTGTPRREFIHADDIANACHHFLNNDIAEIEFPINIGSGRDYSIKELAKIVAAALDYDGNIEWDSSKPDGAPRKLLDSTRASQFGWKPHISLVSGIASTYKWYKEHTLDDQVRV